MNDRPTIPVRVARRFSVPQERVFDAWLDRELIAQWMFGPKLRDEEVLRIAIDARAGGAFSFLVRRQGTEIDHVGTYLEIDRPRRLSFTWGIAPVSGDSSRVTINLQPLETGCELVLTHELQPDWADFAFRTEAAWTKMLDVLAETLR
ncbi:SRPBCC family protein [Verrucomicrobiota bacterium sgz303538]